MSKKKSYTTLSAEVILVVTGPSLVSVPVCFYSLSGRFIFKFVPLPSLGANPLECQRHPQDNPPLITVVHLVHSIHTQEPHFSTWLQCILSVVCIVLKPSGWFLGGNQGGTGSNGGPTVLRNKTTAPKNSTLRHICAREVWIF